MAKMLDMIRKQYKGRTFVELNGGPLNGQSVGVYCTCPVTQPLIINGLRGFYNATGMWVPLQFNDQGKHCAS